MCGESLRFWLPVLGLSALTVYSGQKLIRSHVDPTVRAPNYDFEKDLPARRGTIYSAAGRQSPLAKSVPFWEYRLDPVALTNAMVRRKGEPRRTKEAIVKTIADSLGLDYLKVKQMANSKEKRGWRSQYLALSSDTDAHRTLIDSTLVAGVAIGDRQVRQYLHGRSLAHVLGSVNAEHVGSAGLEQRYNSVLSGTPGKIHGMWDALKRELYDRRKVSIDPIPGSDLFLTIDHNLQYEAEYSLKWGLHEFGAGSGWCVIMDPATGAILAMASLPDYEPLAFGSASDSAKMNRAVAFNYEPGSVMKVITAAAAFDSDRRRFTPERRYRTNRDDSNYYKLPGDGSHVWEPTMTLGDAIVHSSNIVIGKLGCDLGPKTLWTYMTRFGFGEKTGIDLPGEQYGILRNWKKWDKATWSRAAIGQGVSVTAIQLISAYQSIANDGIRLEPYIVDHINDASGRTTYQHEQKSLGRTISAETAQTMRRVMTAVASPAGTARRAAIRGYSVAGKTGTAQKAQNGHYVSGLYRASFCGMVPAGSPRLVVLVTLDFDQVTKFHQGGNSAGPVFRRITTAALRYLSIPPDKPEELEEFVDDNEFDRIMDERAQSLRNML